MTPDPNGFLRVCLCETGGVAVRVMNVLGPERERGQSVTTQELRHKHKHTHQDLRRTRMSCHALMPDKYIVDAIISRRCRLMKIYTTVSRQRQSETEREKIG